MAILLIRAVVLYLILLLAMKVMGKRQLGQLQPFELVVILVISEMASMAMQSPTTTLFSSLVPIATVTVLQILIAILNLKSEKMRALFCGRPVFLIRKGILQEKAMAKLHLNLNDIEEMSRAQGYFDLSGIENAIMETNGQLSIMPKTSKRPLQLGDIEDDPPKEQMGVLLILDGHVNQAGLKACGYDERWLMRQLSPQGISAPKEVFAAGLDETGQFFWQKKTTRLGG